MTLDAPAVAGRPRRRRWPWVLGIVVVAVIAVAVAAELIARAVVPGIVADKLRTALSLPAEHPIAVGIDGLVLPQVVGGAFDHVAVSSDAVPLGRLTADVAGEATGVRLDGTMDTATIHAALGPDQILALVSAAGVTLDDVALGDGVVTGTTALSFWGQRIPLSLTLVPSVADGDLQLTADSIDAGGLALTADGLRDKFGSLVDGLIGPWTVCLRGELPVGVHLTGLAVSADEIIATADVDGRIAVDSALQATGTCG